MKKTKIVSAFPGCGKSYATTQLKNNKMIVLDSDSSNFSWTITNNNEKQINKDFPENYINHIKSKLGKVDIIFVSTHKEVREALSKNQLEYILVYPDLKNKKEYLKRYFDRGNNNPFIKKLENNWNNFIENCSSDPSKFCNKIVLKPGEYLSNALNIEIDKKEYKCSITEINGEITFTNDKNIFIANKKANTIFDNISGKTKTSEHDITNINTAIKSFRREGIFITI